LETFNDDVTRSTFLQSRLTTGNPANNLEKKEHCAIALTFQPRCINSVYLVNCFKRLLDKCDLFSFTSYKFKSKLPLLLSGKTLLAKHCQPS